MKNVSNPEEKKKKRKGVLNTAVQISTAAWTIVANIGVGVFFGQWLDRRLGTQPVFIIVLSILGIIAAIRFLFTFSRKL